MSETVSRNLSALFNASKAFTESEARAKVNRALRHPVRDPNEVIHQPEDKVYFKRNDDIKWKGPAKVLANEGKVVCLRYGSQFIRVSSCRICKMGESGVRTIRRRPSILLKTMTFIQTRQKHQSSPFHTLN